MIDWIVDSVRWVEDDRNWKVELHRIDSNKKRVTRVAYYYSRKLSFQVGDEIQLKG
jgi:hypothetical protein